jgi:hypothetical protein
MKLWIDDIRQMPPSYDIQAHSSAIAIHVIKALMHTGQPITHISFDHDLGGSDEGYAVANWIQEQAGQGNIDTLMTWEIHSMNPVGRARIQSAMEAAQRYIDQRRSHLEQYGMPL